MTPQEPTKGLSGGFFHAGVNTTWAVCNLDAESMIRVLVDGVSLPTKDQNLEFLLKNPNFIVSNKNNGWASRKGGLAVDGPTACRSRSHRWACNFPNIFKFVSIN